MYIKQPYSIGKKLQNTRYKSFCGSIEMFINFKEIRTKWLKKEQNYEDKSMEMLLLFLSSK
jgi:hypothetical protein